MKNNKSLREKVGEILFFKEDNETNGAILDQILAEVKEEMEKVIGEYEEPDIFSSDPNKGAFPLTRNDFRDQLHNRIKELLGK